MILAVYLELTGRLWAVLTLKPLSTLLAAASLLSGCNLSTAISTAAPPAVVSSEPTASAWTTLAAGLEQRLYNPQPDNPLAQLYVLRIDPARYIFRAHYRPGNPQTLSAWRLALPDAAVIVNGNFFDESDQALGLVVADGVPYGSSFQGFGGLFQVQNGQPRVRSTIREPYDGSEVLEQAVQAFPMLVLDGTATYEREDNDISRRTIIAQDRQGRVLLMVTPLVGLSLPALSAYLPTTDMALSAALNLDGGRSTMLSLQAGSASYTLRSFDTVPTVLAIYPR